MSLSKEFITQLENLSCIAFSGPQAQEYLQGQVTIDVTKMSNDKARLGAHCDFKGKAWSVFTAALSQDVFYLTMHKSALEKSLSEFKKYGVFSKVDIKACDDELSFYGVSGTKKRASISSMFSNLSEEHLSVHSNEMGSAICINITSPRYLLMLNEKGKASLDQLIKGDELADENEWNALDILDAMPHITAATSNEFVPQMLNLQAIAGIDFDKGCYMGQETVARTKFLGRNKRAAFILINSKSDSEVEINSGMALEKQVGDNWRSGGTVIQSAVLDDDRLVLGVLANDTQLGDVLRLKEFPELQFEVNALPYKLDEK